MWIGIEIGIAVYCALVGGLLVFQRRLMYFPVKMIAPPSAFGLKGVEDIILEASDNVKLQTWAHAARPGYPTLLYFHGNAIHLGERASWFNAYIDAGSGLVAVSHRGFGKSEGAPPKRGFTRMRVSRSIMRKARLKYLQKNSSILANHSAAAWRFRWRLSDRRGF